MAGPFEGPEKNKIIFSALFFLKAGVSRRSVTVTYKFVQKKDIVQCLRKVDFRPCLQHVTRDGVTDCSPRQMCERIVARSS